MNAITDLKFRTYQDIELAMDDLVEEKIVLGKFMNTLMKGEFTPNQIREFALQYSYYSRNFPRVLGAAIGAVMPEDEWWIPIADNLWDEGGRGNPKAYHSRLYHTFLITAAPDVLTNEKYIPDYPVSPTVIEAVDTFINFLKNATPLEAMASIGFGSEYFAGKIMGMIGDGLNHPNYNVTTKLNTKFWSVHAGSHEPRHYLLCKHVLEQYKTPEELGMIYRAGAYIAMSEARMYEGLYQRMISF
jgi:pyrroloquinoline quinone (PQQ) biosynthesis protein C